jgi:hypothetical protein
MAASYERGDRVRWKWGQHWAYGRVEERFNDRVSRTIKGSEVTRNASEDEPAYLIEQEDGDQILKSQSELSDAD